MPEKDARPFFEKSSGPWKRIITEAAKEMAHSEDNTLEDSLFTPQFINEFCDVLHEAITENPTTKSEIQALTLTWEQTLADSNDAAAMEKNLAQALVRKLEQLYQGHPADYIYSLYQMKQNRSSQSMQ